MTIMLLLTGGLVALVLGGDVLVRGASRVALRFGVSPLLIGLTLVGFGTSTPELVTSLQAAFAGAPGVAIGNVVGSNIANILFILGLAALISPIAVDRKPFSRDGVALVVASLLCLGVVLYGRLQPVVGLAFIACLIAYVTYSVVTERRANAISGAVAASDAHKPVSAPAQGSIAVDLALVVGGIALTILGARWLVTAAVDMASSLGVSETIIGLTIVAVGTSLPELVTSVAAARRGESAIAFGNVVGSNIYNILFILGATAVIRPIDIPPAIQQIDIWVMLGATAALVLVSMSNWRISRLEGGCLVAAYAAYTGWLVVKAIG